METSENKLLVTAFFNSLSLFLFIKSKNAQKLQVQVGKSLLDEKKTFPSFSCLTVYLWLCCSLTDRWFSQSPVNRLPWNPPLSSLFPEKLSQMVLCDKPSGKPGQFPTGSLCVLTLTHTHTVHTENTMLWPCVKQQGCCGWSKWPFLAASEATQHQFITNFKGTSD